MFEECGTVVLWGQRCGIGRVPNYQRVHVRPISHSRRTRNVPSFRRRTTEGQRLDIFAGSSHGRDDPFSECRSILRSSASLSSNSPCEVCQWETRRQRSRDFPSKCAGVGGAHLLLRCPRVAYVGRGVAEIVRMVSAMS